MSKVIHQSTLLVTLSLFAVGQAPAQAPGEDVYEFFKMNCTSCHTIGGGRLTGPDLQNVEDRQERDWLVDFMVDPKGVIDSGDTYAQKIFKEARAQYMTRIPGLDKAKAAKLLDLIAHESTLEKSRFIGMQLSDRPLTEEDVSKGRRLFLGTQKLLEGGPACNSCHTVDELGGLGGGRLGPDLTAAYSRLEGRKALAAWLSAPPSEVMAPVFRDRPLDSEEVLALVAFLKERAASGVEESESEALDFLLAGFGSAAGLLVLFDLAWRKRYRATRKPLVELSKR